MHLSLSKSVVDDYAWCIYFTMNNPYTCSLHFNPWSFLNTITALLHQTALCFSISISSQPTCFPLNKFYSYTAIQKRGMLIKNASYMIPTEICAEKYSENFLPCSRSTRLWVWTHIPRPPSYRIHPSRPCHVPANVSFTRNAHHKRKSSCMLVMCHYHFAYRIPAPKKGTVFPLQEFCVIAQSYK